MAAGLSRPSPYGTVATLRRQIWRCNSEQRYARSTFPPIEKLRLGQVKLDSRTISGAGRFGRDSLPAAVVRSLI